MKSVVRYSGIAVWIMFTVSLIVWWLIFALRQLEIIKELDLVNGSELATHHRMLIWEGGTLLICVIGGGAALLYSAYREIRLSRQLKLFFLTFAHEIKTPLASLRLQAESLKEDLHESESGQLVDRLIADTRRLGMRIENSLFYTSLDNPTLCFEDMKLSALLGSCHHQWPDMEVELQTDALLRVDRRAVEAIFNNLIQNAMVHGRVSRLVVSAAQQGPMTVRIGVSDAGEGFKGQSSSLGELFSRPSGRSGSGLGLFLTRELVTRMGGQFRVLKPASGFAVEFSLRGQIL